VGEGTWLEGAFKWAVGVIGLLLGLVWTRQENAVAALSKRLDEHEDEDNGKFGMCGTHLSAEISDLRKYIDDRTEALGEKIDANHRELNTDIKAILKGMGDRK